MEILIPDLRTNPHRTAMASVKGKWSEIKYTFPREKTMQRLVIRELVSTRFLHSEIDPQTNHGDYKWLILFRFESEIEQDEAGQSLNSRIEAGKRQLKNELQFIDENEYGTRINWKKVVSRLINYSLWFVSFSLSLSLSRTKFNGEDNESSLSVFCWEDDEAIGFAAEKYFE